MGTEQAFHQAFPASQDPQGGPINMPVAVTCNGGPLSRPTTPEDDAARSHHLTPNRVQTPSTTRLVQLLPSPTPSRESLPPLDPETSRPAEKAGDRQPPSERNHTSALLARRTESIDETSEKENLAPPLPLSKVLPSIELHDIPEEKEKVRFPKSPRSRTLSKSSNAEDKQLKLSMEEMQELTEAPESLPVAPSPIRSPPIASPVLAGFVSDSEAVGKGSVRSNIPSPKLRTSSSFSESAHTKTPHRNLELLREENVSKRSSHRPGFSSRTISTPVSSYRRSTYSAPSQPGPQASPIPKPTPYRGRPEPLNLDTLEEKSLNKPRGRSESHPASPVGSLPQVIPLPPMSIPTYLQLELSTSKPSPLFIHRSAANDIPFESSRLKFERLLNFLLLPPQLEQVLFFGTLACLDAWLHTFTILPLRFVQAVTVLVKWWGQVLAKETRYIIGFVYEGSGRMYERQRGRTGNLESVPSSRATSRAPSRPAASARPSSSRQQSDAALTNGHVQSIRIAIEQRFQPRRGRTHRRSKSVPSALSSSHKADILNGLVVVCSCMILMRFDASRMYHSIRGQTDIKLYVIYNVLEVSDKLLSALGQDIFECLNSDETLERRPDGRSKLLRPFGMFLLALIYNTVHAAALFYQVITLNVAVNSYSNALLTLLLSNQFVEVKGAVFKKIEKDNLFQLTCADVVERLQLWLMLVIIALRNVVEVGGFSVPSTSGSTSAEVLRNSTMASQKSYSFLPHSFTLLPSWTGEVLSPFLVVLGSEMLVDWLKHAYISKFNNVKPAVYQKYLDVLAKDYYTNAFINQNLTKRVGLPVLPLACLFIRASFQTYHMFIATRVSPPIASTATSISDLAATTSPATTAALEHFDTIIRRALGRSAYGIGNETDLSSSYWFLPGQDSVIATLTMLIFFLGAFLVLLACKLVLGMCLLRFARNRYRSIKERERLSLDTQGKRLGGWGVVEMDDENRGLIFDGDEEGMRGVRERERKQKEKMEKEKAGGTDLGKVTRYEMSAKRIW